jgi:hypothetical protein
MRHSISAFLVLLPLLALAANPAVDLGVDLYKHGDYKGAAFALKKALSEGVADAGDRARARLYLASVYEAQGEDENARTVLTQLFGEAPEVTIDPVLFPPSFVLLAEQVRAQVASAAPGARVAPPPPALPALPPAIAPAQASRPPAPASTKPEPATSGLTLSLSFGFAYPGGVAFPSFTDTSGTRRVTQSEVYSSTVLFQLGAGWRIDPNWYLGVFGALGPITGANCNVNGCTGLELQAGGEGEFHFLPGHTFDPWLGVAIGIEDVSGTTGLGKLSTEGAMVRLWGGGELRLTQHLLLGPYLSATFGRYATVTREDVTVSTSSATHEWYGAGVRLGYVF